MRILSYILIVIIIGLGISFALLNSGSVSINYYVGHRTMPLSLLLAMVFTIGSLLGVFVGLWLLLKIKLKNYRLKQRLKLAEKEIENLRAIPLQDKH
ncbi:MAG: LapA family protein [Gammaproteobacteria bacterium]|nr:LapA family protein [Gammaproteobacteria bacterium]